MKKADRISGTFWLLLSILMSIESYHLGLGSLHKPGPGFLFFGTGLFLGTMSFVVILRTFSIKKAEGFEKPIFGQLNLAKVTLVLISLFAYALLMEPLGFIPVTLLLFIFLLGVIERKSWLFTTLTSLTATLATYLIFDVWLKSQLPRGLLEFFNY